MFKIARHHVASILGGLLGIAINASFAAGQSPVTADLPEDLEERSIPLLLESLTFEDFALREAVVEELSQRGVGAARELTALALDETSQLHLQACYMLRRAFWSLVPKVSAELTAEDLSVRSDARSAFRDMVEFYPLDVHHHGGYQKEAIVLEKLGHHRLAREAYRLWEPPSVGCGTCDAGIRAEKVLGLIRCLRQLGQLDEAAGLCWEELRGDRQGDASIFALSLVDIRDGQDRLDELGNELGNELAPTNPGRGAVQVGLEYLEICRAIGAGDYQRVLPHLNGGTLAHIKTDIASGGRRTWRQKAVAEKLGQMGESAVPILAAHLSQLEEYNSGWTIYALQQTGSAQVVEPLVEHTEKIQYGIIPPFIAETLVRFPAESTTALIPLLGDQERAHGAIHLLGQMGTEAAVEALIGHIEASGFRSDPYRVAYAEHCVASLWQLTGETLGIHQLPDGRPRSAQLATAKAAWEKWWADRPGDFQVKTPKWWQSPAAAPLLIDALDSPSRYMMEWAAKNLLAIEHPALVRFLEPVPADAPEALGVDRVLQMYASRVAKLWMRYDPEAAIPALIPHARPPGFRLQPLLAPLQRHPENRDALLACRDCKDPAAWRVWWQKNREHMNLEPEERWW